jgi:hypothetical protein
MHYFTIPNTYRFLPFDNDYNRFFPPYRNQIIDSQIADVEANMTNFGTQTDVIQTATSNQISIPAIKPLI